MSEKWTDISICNDCVLIIANGVDSPEQEEIAIAMDKLWGDTQITLNNSEEDEGNFSWESCEGCGSPLGGDRYPAVAWN